MMFVLLNELSFTEHMSFVCERGLPDSTKKRRKKRDNKTALHLQCHLIAQLIINSTYNFIFLMLDDVRDVK